MGARPILVALMMGLALAGGVVDAEAKRKCRKLCRTLIADNIVEHCTGYRGVIKRACHADVRNTILHYCKRQTSGDCLGD